MVAVEVVHGDPEEILAFGRDTDFLMTVDPLGNEFLDLFDRFGDVKGADHGIDGGPIPVVDEDDEVDVDMNLSVGGFEKGQVRGIDEVVDAVDRKSTRLNSSHLGISYAV